MLRSELGTRGQVFTSTAEYRAEIARRFFGGVDPGAYFRLLHQVRNPRVGDRIDTDLPRTLREALPPVPEDAVHDAAQPLEDLEDHRRNVTDLARTAEALDGAVETYTDYARRVLAAAVDDTAGTVDAARTAARRLERDRGGVEKATAAQATAATVVADLTDDHAAATAERAGLAALPEYTAHADLVRRRDEVARADAHTATLDGHRTRARDRVTAAASAVAAARGQLDSDLAGVADGLRAVAAAARAASAPSIAATLPDPPTPATEPRRDEAGETTVDVPQDPEDDLTAHLAGPLTAVGDALRTHRTTVRDVAERASGARRATETAEAADVAAADALAAHEAAAEQAAAARRAARAAADEHADAVAGWTRRLGEHVAAVPPAEPDGAAGWLAVPATGDDEADDDDLRRAAEARRARARHAADDLTATLTQARTVATTRVTDVEAELAQWRAEHARVEDAGELALPRASWRTDDDVADGVRLASLVDFRDHLGDAERAGLEAALEASGLLAAAVDGSDGTGTLRVGDLTVSPSAPAGGTALDTLLAPVDTGEVPVEAVAGVLAAVGVAAGPVHVATDGTFGLGPLRGRHAKPAAEHVGAGARAQARARRLAELAALVTDAEARRDAARATSDALDAHAGTLRRLVAELPGTRGVDDAVAAATGAVRYAEGAEARHRELTASATDARRRADDAWAALSRAAAEAGVPTDPERLDGLLESVVDAERALAGVDSARDRVTRTARSWREAITAWERDAADHATAVGEHRAAATHGASVRTELSTIEESLGEEPAKVAARVGELDDRLREVAGQLEGAREQQTAAAVAVSKAEMTLEESRRALDERQGAARGARGRLVEAAAVPGLLAAAERSSEPVEDADERRGRCPGTPPVRRRHRRGRRGARRGPAGAAARAAPGRQRGRPGEGAAHGPRRAGQRLGHREHPVRGRDAARGARQRAVAGGARADGAPGRGAAPSGREPALGAAGPGAAQPAARPDRPRGRRRAVLRARAGRPDEPHPEGRHVQPGHRRAARLAPARRPRPGDRDGAGAPRQAPRPAQPRRGRPGARGREDPRRAGAHPRPRGVVPQRHRRGPRLPHLARDAALPAPARAQRRAADAPDDAVRGREEAGHRAADGRRGRGERRRARPARRGRAAAGAARRRVREGVRGQPRQALRPARRPRRRLRRHHRAAVGHAPERARAGDHRGAARPGAAGHRARALPVGRGFPGDHGVTGVRTSVFAYVTESPEYRAILTVFAGTFFAELTPAEVTARLAERTLDEATVTARLEALRGWGNLEVSASVGQVGTVEDYYRRRNRYLITRVGQEVHDVVEGVLSQVDDVRDVSLGRLDQLREGLSALAALDAASAPPGRLAEAVRAVFDPHVAFSAEITQFFAAINQWQSRFDLDEDEFAFFSEVLVGYVGERLEALRRRARPVGALLETVLPRVPVIVDRAADGLAARVAAAGLSSVRVRREPGAVEADWENLASWFLGAPGRPSRIQVLERDAVDAVRTLTQNLTRLSRSGTAGASRRADYLRLALFFDRSDPASVHEIAAAAFGLAGARHLGGAGGDDTDPVDAAVSWWDAPTAQVPVSLRERGDTTSRGRTSRVQDRSQERRHLLAKRAEAERRSAAARAELVEAGVEGFTARLSEPALRELQRVLTRAVADLGPASASGTVTLDGVRCTVARAPGTSTSVPTHAGALRVRDLTLTVEPA